MTDLRWDVLLNGWIDESLTDDEMMEFERYIQQDDTLRQQSEDLQKTMLLLKGVSEMDPPPGFRANVMSRIRSSEMMATGERSPVRKKRWIPQSALALAAAVLVVFVSLASIFPQVLPGVSRLLRPDYHAASEGTDEEAGITSNDLGLLPEYRDEAGSESGQTRVLYQDYSLTKSLGAGKMEGFPRQGPNQTNLIVPNDDPDYTGEPMIVPYYWASYQVENLDSAWEAIQILIAQNGGSISEVEGIRLDSAMVRINLTAYIPVTEFDTATQALNEIGMIYDVEESMISRSRQTTEIENTIAQLEGEIREYQDRIGQETDPQESERLKEMLANSQSSLERWNPILLQMKQGIAEISLVLYP